MTLGASTITDAIGGWAQGCLVLLIGVWLFLALLGIRNARFPFRLVGGAVFVVGSAMWIGLHPTLADAWHLDAGRLGWWAQSGLAGRLADGSFMLNAVGALLLLCSLVGFLIAIDWLPLWPFAPLLARLDDFVRTTNAARPAAAGGVAPLPTTLLRSSAAATLEQEPAMRPLPIQSPPPPPIQAAPPAVADPSPSVEDPSPTNWDRFRPRASSVNEVVAAADLPMDNAAAATHNSSTPEGESRASIDVAEPAGSPESEGKDPPVLARDHTEEDATSSIVPPDFGAAADSASTAVAPALPDAPTPTEEELSDELSPRRKKDDEPAEEPGEEPGDDPDDDGDKDGDEDDEAGDDDLTDDEDAEDDDELDKEEDEDWEEDDEEEDEEEEDDEETKDDDEDWDDEDDEDDEDDDEDDEDADEDGKDKDEDDKDEDKDEDWDGDEKGSSTPPAPAASAEPAILEVGSPVAGETAAIDAERGSALEEVADPVAEVATSIPVDGTAVPAELPAHLFSDLPQDERITLVRAVDLILGAESISLSRLQRELGITYYSAARVFERLEKDGFIAPYSGSLARPVQVTREQWEARRRTS